MEISFNKESDFIDFIVILDSRTTIVTMYNWLLVKGQIVTFTSRENPDENARFFGKQCKSVRSSSNLIIVLVYEIVRFTTPSVIKIENF